MSLDGKIALVTGGNGGIGLASAKALAEQGATVFITGRRKEQLDKAVEEIGDKAIAIQGDVSRMEDLDNMVETIRQRAGHLDIIFANAGVAEMLPITAVTEEHYDKMFNINVKGLYFTVQKSLSLLKDNSSIILNASVAGSMGNPNFTVYSATKAAVRNLARTLAADLKDRRIRVNAISPGPIETDIYNAVVNTPEDMEQIKAHFTSMVPLGRFGQPKEIASVVTFLASDASSYMNGSELFVDGGLAQV